MLDRHMPFGVAELCDRGLEACPVRGCAEASPCLTHGIKVHANSRGLTYVYDDPFRNLLWVKADDRQRLEVILRGKRESRMGHEHSEDAVTWNVFRFFERHCCLSGAVRGICSCPTVEPLTIFWTTQGGVLHAAYGVGLLLASGIWLFVSRLGQSSWRYMFLVGILPALLLLYVRRWVDEPAVWTETSRNRREAQQRVQMGKGSLHDKQLVRFTVSEILSDHELRRRIGILLLMSVTTVVGWWSASTWIPEFAAQLNARSLSQMQLSSSMIGLMFSLGSVAGFLTLGFFADTVGRKPTIWFYYLGALVVTVCYFLFARERTALLVMAGVNGFFSSGQFAWMTIYLPELFPTRVRGTAERFLSLSRTPMASYTTTFPRRATSRTTPRMSPRATDSE
jgi:hypothetical protein